MPPASNHFKQPNLEQKWRFQLIINYPPPQKKNTYLSLKPISSAIALSIYLCLRPTSYLIPTIQYLICHSVCPVWLPPHCMTFPGSYSPRTTQWGQLQFPPRLPSLFTRRFLCLHFTAVVEGTNQTVLWWSLPCPLSPQSAGLFSLRPSLSSPLLRYF